MFNIVPAELKPSDPIDIMKHPMTTSLLHPAYEASIRKTPGKIDPEARGEQK